MNILITQLEQKWNATHIKFECPQGQGEGVWQGENAEAGSTAHVEFDIDELLRIKKNTMAEKIYSIHVEDDIAFFTGDIIAIQDEIMVFRFADTIIQLDCISRFIEIGDWVTISAKPENLSIHPVNL